MWFTKNSRLEAIVARIEPLLLYWAMIDMSAIFIIFQRVAAIPRG